MVFLVPQRVPYLPSPSATLHSTSSPRGEFLHTSGVLVFVAATQGKYTDLLALAARGA